MFKSNDMIWVVTSFEERGGGSSDTVYSVGFFFFLKTGSWSSDEASRCQGLDASK